MTNNKLSGVKLAAIGSFAHRFGSLVRNTPLFTKYIVGLSGLAVIALAVGLVQTNSTNPNKNVQVEMSSNSGVSNLDATTPDATQPTQANNNSASSNSVDTNVTQNVTSSADSSSSSNVTVNGQSIPVPNNGSTTKTLQSPNGETTVQIDNHNSSASTDIQVYSNSSSSVSSSDVSHSSGTSH